MFQTLKRFANKYPEMSNGIYWHIYWDVLWFQRRKFALGCCLHTDWVLQDKQNEQSHSTFIWFIHFFRPPTKDSAHLYLPLFISRGQYTLRDCVYWIQWNTANVEKLQALNLVSLVLWSTPASFPWLVYRMHVEDKHKYLMLMLYPRHSCG